MRPNLDFASLNSKTRNGAFNIKCWVSSYYSTLAGSARQLASKNTNLNPSYITGFTDGEGCFSIKIYKSSRNIIGWQVQPVFQIKLHNRDIVLLEQIKDLFLELG